MTSSGSAVSAKEVKPTQIDEHDGDLPPVGLERVGGAPGHDELRELRGEEALEPAQPLELGHLLRDAVLQRLVQLRELAALARLLIVKALLLQARADPRLEQHGLERLAEVVLGPELDAAHHAVHLVQRRDHEDRDVAKGRIGLEPLEHRVAVEVRHHHVEQHQVHGRPGERGQRGPPAGRGEDLVVLAPKPAGEHVAVVLVVVHDQDHPAVRDRWTGAGLRARLRPGLLAGRRRTRRTEQLVEPPGGRVDTVQIGEQLAGAGLCRPSPQRLAGRADAPERRAQRAARGCEVRRARVAARQHLVQQGQELARVPAQGGEAGGQIGLVAGLQLLEQHLGVTDDVVQRRAQLVPELRGGVDAHAPPGRPSSASIFSSSRARSTGLVSKSSQPAATAFSRSPDIACAVSAITGMRPRLRRRLDPAGRLPAVQPRQAHVHQDQRRRLRPRHGHALLAVDRDGDLVAAPGEAARQHVAVHLVVLDEQDLGHQGRDLRRATLAATSSRTSASSCSRPWVPFWRIF